LCKSAKTDWTRNKKTGINRCAFREKHPYLKQSFSPCHRPFFNCMFVLTSTLTSSPIILTKLLPYPGTTILQTKNGDHETHN
jgi:hypothetical protein